MQTLKSQVNTLQSDLQTKSEQLTSLKSAYSVAQDKLSRIQHLLASEEPLKLEAISMLLASGNSPDTVPDPKPATRVPRLKKSLKKEGSLELSDSEESGRHE